MGLIGVPAASPEEPPGPEGAVVASRMLVVVVVFSAHATQGEERYNDNQEQDAKLVSNSSRHRFPS